MSWLKNAKYVEETCGCWVDYEEEFYICPECGEPVYADDWNDEELNREICPICELKKEDLK